MAKNWRYTSDGKATNGRVRFKVMVREFGGKGYESSLLENEVVCDVEEN